MQKQTKVLNIKINPTIKQGLCWDKLRDRITNFILFGGGAGGSKSWQGCVWLLVNCLQYPGTKWFIGRNELKRIMKSTFITFQKVCKWHKIPDELWKLNSQYSYIEFYNGSRIDLIDVVYKPADPLFERFGSEEYTGGWLEEVGEIKNKAFDVLKSRIGRHLNDKYNLIPKMFLTCNPKKNWVYFEIYNPWRKGTLNPDTCFIQSLYNDNPYTASEYGKILAKIKDPVMRQRLMDGNWDYDDDDSALMTYDDILAIFIKIYIPMINEQMYMTLDVARFGRDKAVLILWQGYHIAKIWSYEKSSAKFLKEKIEKISRVWNVSLRNVIVDQDGAGGIVDYLPEVNLFVSSCSAVDEFDDEKRYRHQETDRYSFKNLRAQCYFHLADLIKGRMITCYQDLPPDVRNWIIEELQAIRRKDITDNEKKLQIISKDDIKDALGRSCDFSDAMAMRSYFDLGRPKTNQANPTNEFEVSVEW